MGYVPSHQEEREGAGHETWRKRKEWVREHEERERAVRNLELSKVPGMLKKRLSARGDSTISESEIKLTKYSLGSSSASLE